MTKRIMLDTHEYDKVAGTPGLTDDVRTLVEAGVLEILTTHIQEDELARIPDAAKREAVSLIPRKEIPTTDTVLDVSVYGKARLGTGEAGGLRYKDIQAGNIRHSEDALIAMAAASEADVLVTDERRLTNRVRASAATVEVWDFATFAAYVAGEIKKLRLTLP